MNKKEIVTTVYEYDSINELPEAEQELILQAKKAVKRSYSPYSKFSVGAAVLLANGEIIQGNNQENSAYPSGLCAERTVVFYANSRYPDVAVKAIAIVCFSEGRYIGIPVAPCGACRQVLLETEERFGVSIRTILYGEKKIKIVENIKQLLPIYFEKSMLPR